jgi:transcriptional regulator with XRE-family HTH domain
MESEEHNPVAQIPPETAAPTQELSPNRDITLTPHVGEENDAFLKLDSPVAAKMKQFAEEKMRLVKDKADQENDVSTEKLSGAKLLTMLREDLGLSRPQLAAKIGLNRSVYTRAETTKWCSRATAEKISKYFNQPVALLFPRYKDPEATPGDGPHKAVKGETLRDFLYRGGLVSRAYDVIDRALWKGDKEMARWVALQADKVRRRSYGKQAAEPIKKGNHPRGVLQLPPKSPLAGATKGE